MFPTLAPAGTGVLQVAQIIQLAVAQVFLLAGVGAFLNVCAGRLARIIDRARDLEPRISSPAAAPNTTGYLANSACSTGAWA